MDFTSVLFLLVGVAIGSVLTALVYRQKQKSLAALEDARRGDRRDIENAFASLSLNALTKNSEQFLVLAQQKLSEETATGEAKLEEKKKLIDVNLENIAKKLANLNQGTIELKTGLSLNKDETSKLRKTTEDLRNVLSSSQARGQWGEKMVEDILNLVGLVEHINFVK